MPVSVLMDMGKIALCPSLYSAMWKVVIALLWGNTRWVSGRIASGGINIHYKLHGLEATNDNAFKRYIVLHPYTPLPETEVYPLHLPLGISQGCPVISDEVMRKVDGLLKAEKKPVLLWVYD